MSGWLYIVYAHPPTKNYLSQLSCHIIKGKEQSGSFVSSHFWGDKEGTFSFFGKKKKKTNFFFLCLPPLSGGLILLNFNIWSSNRCILELCTPWTKTEPHPQQLFNWQISSLSLAYKNTQTTSGNVCFVLKFSVSTSQRLKLSIKCIYIYQTKVQVGYKLIFEVFIVYVHLYFCSKTEIIFSVSIYLRS